MSKDPYDGKAKLLFYCVIICLISSLVISSVVCFLRPKIYVSRVLVAANERPGRKVELAPVHAAQVIRLTGDQIPWGKPPGDEIATLCRNTRIVAFDDGVMIEVERTNKVDARDIANEIAWLFRGMDEEQRLADYPADLPPLKKQDARKLDDRRQVEELLGEEVDSRPGFNGDFRMVPYLADHGSEIAGELWRSDTFQMHWKFLENVLEVLAGGPSFNRPPFAVVRSAEISKMPSSPNVDLHLKTGMLCGLSLGMMMGFMKIRRLERITGSLGVDVAAESRLIPPASPSRRAPTPEDDW